MTQMIRVTRIKGRIRQKEKIKAVIDGMGLRRVGDTREYKDNNCIRGMINKVKHLVSYEILP